MSDKLEAVFGKNDEIRAVLDSYTAQLDSISSQIAAIDPNDPEAAAKLKQLQDQREAISKESSSKIDGILNEIRALTAGMTGDEARAAQKAVNQITAEIRMASSAKTKVLDQLKVKEEEIAAAKKKKEEEDAKKKPEEETPKADQQTTEPPAAEDTQDKQSAVGSVTEIPAPVLPPKPLGQKKLTPDKLKNPLDNYRSFSYHFILSVASTTSAFEKMLGKDGEAQLATIRNVPLGGQLNIDGEKAFLLVDTRRYSHYSITDITTEHIYGTGSSVNPTVPASTLSMKLIDTTGLSFFNTLMNTLQVELQTTRSSAFFLLTTVYVGHKDDGTTQTIMVNNTPITLITMDFEFTSSGSSYNIEFMEMEGAPQRGASMEYMNSLGDITTISTKNHSNNLGGMIQSLEDALNQRSLEVYQKYSIQNAKKAGSQQTKRDPKTPKSGKLVQYMITIPEGWKNFPINAASRSVNVEQNFIHIKPQKSTDEIKKPVKQNEVAAAAQDSAKHFSYTMGITDAIKAILETSKDVLDLSQPKDGMATMFRTVTNVTSDNASYVIHFDVMEHKIPAKPKDGKAVPAGSTNAFPNAPIIEYDYIFTGKNSDIKELKIAYMPGVEAALDTQSNMGQTRYAVNANAGQVAKNVESVKKGTEESVEFNPNIRPNDPIFFANKSVLAKTGAHDQQEAVKHEDALAFNTSKQLYTQALAFYHYISSMQITMTIRGNPALLAKYADRQSRGGVPPHTQIVSVEQVDSYSTQQQSTAEQNFQQDIKGRVASAKANYVQKYLNEKIKIADVATTPLFVKINIRAPRVDANGNVAKPDSEGGMFTDEFFFKGTYQVLIIKSNFSGGEFTQELELIPLDITGAYSESGSASGKQENPSQSTGPYRKS